MRGALAWIVTLIAGCAPDFGHTAFLCDDAGHGCPEGQMCTYGRCWRGTPRDAQDVGCVDAEGDAGLCTVGAQQCCVDPEGSAQCGSAGAHCPGISALCDGPDDCTGGNQCCADGNTVFCDATCNHYACRIADDCPLSLRHCCHDQETPWGVCSADGC